MKKEGVLADMKSLGAVAVVRAQDEDEALEQVWGCVKGGLNAIELTFTTPFAHRVLERLAREFGPRILLGAGTVLDSEMARVAMLSGADFIVSPHFDEEIVKTCRLSRKAVICGVVTPTEVMRAMEAGCDILKLFPAGPLGPDYLKALLGPFPYAQIMPTGGISTENAGDWIKAGAVAVGAGGSLMKGDITQNARELLARIRAAREEKKCLYRSGK